MMWPRLIAAVIQTNKLRAVLDDGVVTSRVGKEMILLVFFKPPKLSGYSEIGSCGSFLPGAAWAGAGEILPHFTPLQCVTEHHKQALVLGSPVKTRKAAAVPGLLCCGSDGCGAHAGWNCWPRCLCPLFLCAQMVSKGCISLPSSNYTHGHCHALTGAH